MGKLSNQAKRDILRSLGIVSQAPRDHPVYQSGPLVVFGKSRKD